VVHREVLWSPGGGVAHARRFVTYFWVYPELVHCSRPRVSLHFYNSTVYEASIGGLPTDAARSNVDTIKYVRPRIWTLRILHIFSPNREYDHSILYLRFAKNLRAALDGESRPWKLEAVSTKISAQAAWRAAWSTHYNNIKVGVISPICISSLRPLCGGDIYGALEISAHLFLPSLLFGKHGWT
jgi:hypothetical protein